MIFWVCLFPSQWETRMGRVMVRKPVSTSIVIISLYLPFGFVIEPIGGGAFLKEKKADPP
jgi:hypothetical protein